MKSLRPIGFLHRIGPVLVGGASFACSNIFGKLTFAAGTDVLTMLTFRSFVGIALIYGWLRLGQAPAVITPQARWISLGLGVLFAANVYFLFTAIATIAVPIAVLTYFVYPLLTGLVGAWTGMETLGWKGIAAALVAFLGLGLMIGAHPETLATVGVAAALGAAVCRVLMLLITRATLTHTDARLITWYSLLSSTALFAAVSLATWNWQPPQTGGGWAALVGISISTTLAVLMVFVSTVRIGPFRTALFMHLEPLLTMIASALLLREMITPLQALGGAVMLAALVAFQLRR